MFEGDYPTALGIYAREAELQRRSGRLAGTAYALINQGDMLWRLGRYQESAARLEDAHKILQQLRDGSTAPLKRLSLVRAHALLSQSRPREARLQARAALPSAARGSALRVLEAQAAFGLALARSGQAREGRLWCERALRTAQQANIPAGISGAKLALAEAALASGDLRTGELAEEARVYSVQSGHRNLRSGRCW